MTIDRSNIQNIYPLTPLQAGMYFHSESDPASGAYVEQWSMRAHGEVRPNLVRDSWNDLFARHEIFRSVFTPGDGTHPLQVILRTRQVEFAIEDFSPTLEPEQAERLSMARERDRARPFQLGGESLVRIRLIRLAPQAWEIIWTHHHIILDGWSAGVVQSEFLRIYAAKYAGLEASLPPAPSFSRFVKSLPATVDAAFWRDYLDGCDSLAELPRTQLRRPAALGRLLVDVTPDTSARLDAFCRAEGVTLSTFVQAVWGIILARYANADDVMFGYVVSGRGADLPGIERMVGLCINTLPARVTLRAEETFRDLVKRLQQRAADLTAHQHTPLADIQRVHGSGGALFTHVVAVENFPAADDAGTVDTGFNIVSATSDDRTHYGFDVVVLPGRDHLRVRLSWDESKYDADLMARIGDQLSHVIAQVIDRPDVHPSRMNILPPDQWGAVVALPNQTQATYPTEATISSIFDAQAARTPDAPALLAPHDSDRWTSYRELQARADAVAAHLVHDLGIPAGSRVAVCLSPSASSIASILGVMKAGCTYVPVDPRYPLERVQFILQDSGARAVLTDGTQAFAASGDVPAVEVDRIAASDTRSLPGAGSPDNVAYVIYTSGSTGTPKGCQVTHRNVVRLVVNDRHDFDFGSSDVWILAHSLSFDFSVWEIYGALLYGGRLVIPSREVVQDVPAFRDLLARCRVTVLNQTPLAFANLIAVEADLPVHTLGEHLRYVVFGGDRLDAGSLQSWIAYYPPESIALINMYGITETTVHVTFCRLTREQIESPSRHSPIGGPIAETTVYVCDWHLNPQPLGAPGEMLVGGSGVCRGYLNRPDLTAQRFVPDVFAGSGYLYRSGDLAIRGASGALSFIGRNDDQVKIRGHRIEPAEIERALLAMDGVNHAAILVEPGASGNELIACIAGRASAGRLRDELSRRLPGYMVPSRFVVCESLPLTAHGKLDRAAVMLLIEADAPSDAFDPPATEREQILAEIWAACLGVGRVGRHDRFINLGGDSIKSIQILARLRARGLNLELKDLFAHPTVAELAPRITERRPVAAAPESDAPFALTPIQRRFFEVHPIDRDHFNHTVLLQTGRTIDAHDLRRSLQSVYDAHGALRLRFVEAGDGAWTQRIAPRGEAVHLAVVDLQQEADPSAAIYRLSAHEQTGMNLGAGPLFRAVLYRLRDGDRLLLTAHHLVVDGVTWRILLEDLSAALAGGARPSPTDSFSQWSRALHDPELHRRLALELPFWRQMDGPSGESSDGLPFASGLYADAREELIEWDEVDTLDLLRPACAAYQTNAGELVLTAVARALGSWSGRPTLRVALEGHGRTAAPGCDVSRTAGWFTTLYPFVLDLHDGPAGDRIRQLKEGLRRIPNNGAGYGILRYLSPVAGADALRASPTVSFNYLGEFSIGASGGIFSPSPDPLSPSASPDGTRPFALDIAAIVIDGTLRLSLTYSARHVDPREMRRLRDAMNDELRLVVRHCLSRRAPELTPADLTHKDLSLEELDSLFDED